MKTLTTLAKKKLVISALEDIKAHDIQAIDVRKITAIFDWIVVASAESARQTKALSRHVRDALKDAGATIIGTEGEEGGDWVLVDAGDIVAHVMQPAVRQYYNLEELWSDGKFDKVVNSTEPVPVKREPAAAKRKPAVAKRKPAPRARAKPATKRSPRRRAA